jgi:hypothetical protein
MRCRMNYRWKMEARWRRRYKVSDFWIKIEEGVEAGLQLLLDLVFAAFESVHGHVRLMAVVEFQCCIANFGEFVGRKQPQSVNQSQVCHALIVTLIGGALDGSIFGIGKSGLGNPHR